MEENKNMVPDLAPRSGMTAKERRAELDGAKFVSVRNLVHLVYKKPDNTPLMSYHETLENREKVKQKVIEHEIALGLVVADGTEQAVLAEPPPEVVAIPPPGPAPEKEKVVDLPPQPSLPTMAAPPPQLSSPPAPKMRTRRPIGTAAAPPPPPAPPVFLTGTTVQSGHKGDLGPAFMPQSQDGVTFTQSPPAPPLDLSPVLERLAALSKDVDTLGRLLSDESKARYQSVEAVRQEIQLMMVAIHHLYASSQIDPRLRDKVQTLEGFRNFLGGFLHPH